MKNILVDVGPVAIPEHALLPFLNHQARALDCEFGNQLTIEKLNPTYRGYTPKN